MKSKRIIFQLLMAFWCINSYSIDTLIIKDIKSEIHVYDYISIFEDKIGTINIDTFLLKPQDYQFYKNKDEKLNFGYSKSTFWFKMIVFNGCSFPIRYNFEISNPDLDYVNFFEILSDSIKKEIITGELTDVKTREVYHRNFVFNINLDPGQICTYYISIKKGRPLIIPFDFKESTNFHIVDNRKELVYWSIYGLLFFIIIFNLYLYRSTKDKVNLFYSLYVFFATIFFFYYDGYFFFFNPPAFLEKFKYIYPGLYIVFLLSFTPTFSS